MIPITIFRIFSLMLGLFITVAVSRNHWQNHKLNYTNFLYPFMSELFQPQNVSTKDPKQINKASATTKPIAILTVDSGTIKKYGWPIAPEIWRKVSEKIKKNEPLAVLNLLRFSQSNLDSLLRNFSKINTIGSSLSASLDAPLFSGPEEDLLIAKGMLWTQQSASEELIPLPLLTEESQSSLEAYKKIGILPYFIENQKNNCFELFKEFRSKKGVLFTVPYSTFWALEIFQGKPLSTPLGARADLDQAESHVTQKIHCFNDSFKTTHDYLTEKGIQTISLSDFYMGRRQFTKGSFIILSADGVDQSYPAPSPRLIPPHIQSTRGDLVARILSEHINGEEIQIGSGFVTQHQISIIIILFTIVSLGYLFGFEWSSLLAAAILFLAVMFLSDKQATSYEIPGIMISFGVILFIVFTICILITDRLRRNLKEKVAFKTLKAVLQTEDIPQVDQAIFYVGKRFLLNTSAEGFLQIKETNPPFQLQDKVPLYLKYLQTFFHYADRASCLVLSQTISEIRTNAVDQELLRQKHQEQQKMIIENKAKSDILGKFLANSLISKISNQSDKNFYGALKDMIKPSYEWVAVLQADIRGFSNLTSSHPPEQVVKLLKGYFQETVDFAQNFAQIKLIGDAIFLFSIAKDVESASDLVLKAAIQLIRSTDQQNKTNESGAKIRFGVALNFGRVVVGNLSSDECIDFTIIGNEVNKTARLEEMTKNKAIAEIIGDNSLIITREFYNSLGEGKNLAFKWIDLPSVGVSVRSFSEVSEVGYLKLEF